ncbi:MAG: flagellar motor switch protein FliM [Christensenellales bacterium]
MAEILTQNEIDELLSVLADGNETLQAPTQKITRVRPYNFQTANKFPKEQIRMLNLIYDNYAKRLSTYLSGALRAFCEVEIVSIEEQIFSEFINSRSNPVLLGIFNMPPLAGSSLIELSSAIAYEIISRIFGGMGQIHDSGKQFTEIEISIITRILQQMLLMMNECWEKVADINAELDRIETSAQFTQIAANNEPIAIVTLNVKIGDVSDIINFCIPHVAIQPVAKKLASKMWYNDSHIQQSNQNKLLDMSERIAGTVLTLHAVFDTTYATVKDIVNLQVGDVIRVDHHIDKQINVNVEHIAKFTGFIGMQGQRIAVKVSEVLKEEMLDE